MAFVPNFTNKTLPYFDPLGNGIAVYESIRLNDPTGPLADDATFATANAYFLDRRYEDADYHYELIRKEYPQSEFQVQAHLLGLRAKLRTYQGAEYDDKSLGDSEKLIDATLTQFGAEIPEERDRLVRAQRAIRAQKAEREWANGEYYYNRKYYRAARVYYTNVLKTFPDTNFAEMAQARLDETKNYRPVPKNYFTWVGRVFGERKRDYQ
jgi:outer membrane protein assembly factor BamD (BamD/ComL family)